MFMLVTLRPVVNYPPTLVGWPHALFKISNEPLKLGKNPEKCRTQGVPPPLLQTGVEALLASYHIYNDGCHCPFVLYHIIQLAR